MSGRSVGVDVGGTFTDLVAVGADGRVETRKVSSTPEDQSIGVADALRSLGAADIARLIHGTTVATNALLERKGARVVLCATEGFTDLLELRRQDRASLYDLAAHHPPALVPRERCVAVPERMGHDGPLRAPDPDALERVVDDVLALDPEIVAVCLLHAYAHPAHERLLRDTLARRAPRLEVVLSSDVFPEIREYERATTTSTEAYLRPRVARYLGHLGSAVGALGAPPPAVMTSSGGMRPARDAAGTAAQLALSGPAGGVVGAAHVLRLLKIDRALTIDIGGTSADVGLVLDGEPLVEPGGMVAGVPIALPRVLVETVSAGGGSIAWVDDGGALRVGPRSAGAVPGPAAFARGGTDATVTDAHVVLGTIATSRISGGISIDAAAAHAAVGALAARLEVEPSRVAQAIVDTADATMARTLRRLSVERGIDPRSCHLVAFGGGGPLHACGLAARLGVGRVVVPPHAGVLSALGLAIAAERREGMRSVMRTADSINPRELETLLSELAGATPAPADWAREWRLRARYAGQGHELDVPVAPGASPSDVARRFVEIHQERYGFTLDRPIELVSCRHAVTGPIWRAALIDDRAGRDAAIEGPASIDLPDATLYVRAGWRAVALPVGGWMLEDTA